MIENLFNILFGLFMIFHQKKIITSRRKFFYICTQIYKLQGIKLQGLRHNVISENSIILRLKIFSTSVRH